MRRLVLVLALLGACAGQDAPPSSKPLPPVDLTVTSTDLGSGRWQVHVAASPLLDATLLGAELSLPAGARLAGGEAQRSLRGPRAGDRADFTAEVEAAAGSELVVTARIRLADGFEAGRVVRVPLGVAPKPARSAPKPRRVVHTAVGDVAEVAR